MNNPDPVANPHSARPWLYKPGQSGNPGGTAAGARKRLTGDFLRCLAEDFAEHGKETLQRLRVEDPRAYIGAVVKLCPRELEVTQAFEASDNEEMQFILALAKQYMQVRRARTLEQTAEGVVESVP